MEKLESKEALQPDDHPAYAEAPPLAKPDFWNQHLLPVLSFVIPYVLVGEIMEIWFPWHIAIGIGCLVGFLVQYRFSAPVFHHFGKSLGFFLVASACASMLALALKNFLAGF